jgi:hypothetical protein
VTPADGIDTALALATAARTMLEDAHDEAAGLAMVIEEAGEALDDGGVLRALGTLADYDARAKALREAVDAARTLLLRARSAGGRP